MNTLVAAFNPFPELTTARMVMRQLSPDDLPEIFFHRSNQVVLQYLDRDGDKTMEDTARWLEMVMNKERGNEVITWGMAMKGEAKLIGSICFWNFKMEHFRAEVGYGLDPAHHGKGLMQEALSAALEYGFEEMKLHSVEANVNPANEASIKLLERNHFVREAYFKDNMCHNGHFVDSAIYSLLEPEWRKHR